MCSLGGGDVSENSRQKCPASSLLGICSDILARDKHIANFIAFNKISQCHKMNVPT
jgi:hypothetical protein